MKVTSALFLARQGFRVFPITPNTRVPPKDFHWKAEATTDPAKIEGWWTENPQYNIAVATGGGVVVIDADSKKGRPGLESLDLLDMMGLPTSLRVKTPSTGVHVYLGTAHQHRNRVDTVPDYPGLDIRSDGGYVLAPGSVVDGVPYEWLTEGCVENAPPWLDELLLKDAPTNTPKSEQPLVDLDRPENLAKGKHYLENNAPDAVEGAGGDATTYKVAARLRDFGLSESSALELMLEHWNEKQSPPWMPDALETKIANAFEYASGGWGAGTAAGEFDVIDIDVGQPPSISGPESADFLEPVKKGQGMHFLTYAEMCAMPEPEWLVEGVVQKRSSALMFGKSNTFKSFLAIDIGLSVATGKSWHGHAVSKGRVLFVATEGANGVGRLRVPGWYGHHSVDEADRHNALLYPKEIRLDVVEDVDALVAAIRQGGPMALVVLDIFGGTMAGTEVEDTTARAWTRAVQHIMRSTGTAMLTVAHTGWQDETRARMHTHFWGSFDSRMRVDGDKEARTSLLTVERHKDADSSGSWGFNLANSGETLVPVYNPDVRSDRGAALPMGQKLAVEALDEALETHGILKVDPAWPSCRIVSISTWREFCDRKGLTSSEKADAKLKAFNRARDALRKAKIIDVQESFVWSNFDA